MIEHDDHLIIENHMVKPFQQAEFMCSSSHTYGNAIAFIQNWLINLFPENFFKTIHVNSKIAHRQIISTPKSFKVKERPIFAISPRVDFDDSRFLEGTALLEPRLGLHFTHDMGALMPFFRDDSNGFDIRFQLNRSIMYADVIIILSTKMEQMNFMDYLLNKTVFNHPQDVNTFLESYLSPSMMDTISKITGIPIVDEDGTTARFLTYLNSHSIFPITYKLQGGSRLKEFYRYYPVKIDTLLSSLSSNDGEKSGYTTTDYQITFSVRMEFFTTGLYYLFSNKKIPDIPINKEFDSRDIIIPTYTDVMLKEDLNLQNGWNLFTNVSFRLEKKNDDVDFGEVINTSIREAVNYHLKNGLPLFDLIDIKVRRQGVLLFENKDYKIDWDNYNIKFNNDKYGLYTYTMYICINFNYIQTLVKTLFDIKG